MRNPRSFFEPLAIGAPEPLREIPVRPSRMIHFLDFSNEKMVGKAAGIAAQTDILLGNLEDAIPVDRKVAAREGLIRVGEARAELQRPILVHAILETAQGVANVEEIATASPRMQGMSLGPADLAASRRMKTTRVGGGHPGYLVLGDPNGERTAAQQDLWHYTLGRMVDACAAAGILPFYGPFGDIKDLEGCEAQFRAAYLMGCVGAWSLHPAQLDIARKVFSPDPDEVAFAKKVIEAIPDGRGVHMIDGKMQDDATWKQCRVMVDLAEMLARKDPELKAAYEL
jgi:malyl-CoA/(S)-citramalyl-CoA lyase